jgi:hypothetical protein
MACSQAKAKHLETLRGVLRGYTSLTAGIEGIGDIKNVFLSKNPPHPALSRQGRGFSDSPPLTGGGRGRVIII